MGREADRVLLKVTLRYQTIEEFVERYAENVSSAGLFIRTQTPKPVGTKVRFDLTLVDGATALEGEGVVVSTKTEEEAGMSIRFSDVSDPSQSLIDRVVAAHGQGALAPTPIAIQAPKGPQSRPGTGPMTPFASMGLLQTSRLPQSPLVSKPAQRRGTQDVLPKAPIEAADTTKVGSRVRQDTPKPPSDIDKESATNPDVETIASKSQTDQGDLLTLIPVSEPMPSEADTIQTTRPFEESEEQTEAVAASFPADAPTVVPGPTEFGPTTVDTRKAQDDENEPTEDPTASLKELERELAALGTSPVPTHEVRANEVTPSYIAPSRLDSETAYEPIQVEKAAQPQIELQTEYPQPRGASPLTSHIYKKGVPEPASTSSSEDLTSTEVKDSMTVAAPGFEPNVAETVFSRTSDGEPESRTIFREEVKTRPAEPRADSSSSVGPTVRVGLDLGEEVVQLGYLNGPDLQPIEIMNAQAVSAWVVVDDEGKIVVGPRAKGAAADRRVSVLGLLRALSGDLDDGFPLEDGKVKIAKYIIDPYDILHSFFSVLHHALKSELGHNRISLHISVPADLGDDGLSALRSMCRRVELPDFHLEPIPQVLLRTYHLHDHFTKTALTLYLDERRLSTSVAVRRGERMELLRTSVDRSLGANVVDRIIAKAAVDWLQQRGHRNLDATVEEGFVASAKLARPELRRVKTLELRQTLADKSELVVNIPRVDIEEAARDYVAKILRCVRDTLEKAKIDAKEVSATVVAGSASEFPPLLEALNNLVGRESLNTVPAGTAVLLGLVRPESAGRREAVDPLQGLVSSVGISIPGGRFLPLVHAGTELPASIQRAVPSPKNRKTTVQVELFQGDGESVRLCTSLGVLELENIPGKEAQLELQVEINTDGIVIAKLREGTTNRQFRLMVPTQQTPAAARRQISNASQEAVDDRGFFRRLFGR